MYIYLDYVENTINIENGKINTKANESILKVLTHTR